MLFLLLAVVYLGWTLGANDTANAFGAGVASELISYRLAIILAWIVTPLIADLLSVCCKYYLLG